MNNDQRDFLVRQEQRRKQRLQDAGPPADQQMNSQDFNDIPAAMAWWTKRPDWTLDNVDGDWGMWDEMNKSAGRSNTPWGALLMAWRKHR